MASLLHETSYNVNIQLLTNNQKLYQTKIDKGNSKKDSGFDLFVPNHILIPAGKIVLIDMKVKCAVYRNNKTSPYYLYARSSVSNRGIMLVNSVGIIDSGYRGSLMAAFYNTTNKDVKIPEGERIVQICMPNLSYDFKVNLVDSLDETERGEGGLGSTGL